MSRIDPLSQASLRLRNAAPTEWDEFVKEIETYYGHALDALVDAPASEIMTVKGNAQQIKAFLRCFKECNK